MEPNDSSEEEGPFHPYISPDDRLWRHPSEMPTPPLGSALTTRAVPSRMWTVALLAGVVGALLASGVSVATGSYGNHTTVVQPVTKMVSPASGTFTSTPTAGPNWPVIVSAIASSVVGITVRSAAGTSSASGVLYSLSGTRAYVLTDAGLLANGGRIIITFNGGQAESGYLMHSDPKSGLALLSVSKAGGTLATLGSVAPVQVAEPVIAVGARPAGDGGTVVTGAISGLDQTVVSTNGSSDVSALIAVSATALPTADAGGALVDGVGAVIGIATSLQSNDPSQQGTTFAVPIDVASHIADELLAGDMPTHPWLGIADSGDLGTTTAQSMGVSGGGARVVDVDDPSPATEANLQLNDVITSFDGQPVRSTGALTAVLNRCHVGTVDPITYVRRGRVITTSIRVAEQPNDTNASDNP